MRFALTLLTVFVLATILHARPIRLWTQQDLYDESDFVAIVTADSPAAVPNSHEFVRNDKTMDKYLQQHESRLTVHAVLKGDRGLKHVTLVHFLKRASIKGGLEENGPSYIWMATQPIKRQNNGWEQKPRYLVYLRNGADGKFDPVTGQMDPANSVVRLIPFPERDPAMDHVEEEPEQ